MAHQAQVKAGAAFRTNSCMQQGEDRQVFAAGRRPECHPRCELEGRAVSDAKIVFIFSSLPKCIRMKRSLQHIRLVFFA